MELKAFRSMNSFQQLMFSAFVIVGSFLIFAFIAMLIAIPVFNLQSIFSFPSLNELDDPEAIKIFKYFQVIQSLGLFIIPSLILGFLFSGNAGEYLLLNRKPAVTAVLLVTLLTVIISPGINFIGHINSRMVFPDWLSSVEEWMRNAEDEAARLTDAFVHVKTTGGLLFNLFMIALLPAVGEELLFRGVIQRIFSEWTRNYHAGIWISAFLFSALHFQFYGFVPRLFLGVMFGYLLVWSGTMWLPVISHFINNAAAVLSFYLADRNLISPKIEDYGATPESFHMALISLLLGILFMVIIRRQYKGSQYMI